MSGSNTVAFTPFGNILTALMPIRDAPMMIVCFTGFDTFPHCSIVKSKFSGVTIRYTMSPSNRQSSPFGINVAP